ncbi:autophagy-related protein 16-1-like isoform X2 [Varroa destructor]|uniref:Autophagy-related protein 16 domain-containing protein n=1 Tax=Varroa destructor TaxID=109461 RepID=A0A7M7J8G7_VARDE|nr:autophagy-related protein 16-1-like isoform X2 [Varroa destructor]
MEQPWLYKINEELDERNRKEKGVFEEIVRTTGRYQEQVQVLREQITQLNVRLESLRQENNELRSRAPSSADGSALELERKLYKLQEEHTELLKKKGEHAQQIIDLRNQHEAKDKELLSKESQLREQQYLIDTMSEELKKLREENQSLRASNQTMRDEHDALHMTYESLERRHHAMEKENIELVQSLFPLRACDCVLSAVSIPLDISGLFYEKGFIKLKAEHAQIMNEENEKFVQRKQKQMQKQLQDAAREEVTVALEEGPAPGAFSTLPNQLITKFDAHDGEVYAVQWSYSSKMLATGGADRKVKIWDFNGEFASLRCTLSGSNMAITSICMDTEDEAVLAANNDMSARVWTIHDQRLRHTLTGHSAKVMAAKFLNGTSNVATGSHDRTLKLWDLKKNCCLRTLFAGSSCNDLIISDCAATNIISGHFDKKVRFWYTRSDTSPTEILLGGKITSLDLSSDRFYVLCCVRDDTLKVIDVRANQVLSTFCDDDFRVGYDFTRAKFSSDGTRVVVGSADGTLFVWSTLTNKLEVKLRKFTSAIVCTSWSPSGDFVASSGKEQKAASTR